MPSLPKRTAAAAPNRIPSPDEATWLDHLTRWREAGVCLAAYARSANLKIHRLYAWKSRLKSRGLWQNPEPVSFLPVHVLDSPSERATPQKELMAWMGFGSWPMRKRPKSLQGLTVCPHSAVCMGRQSVYPGQRKGRFAPARTGGVRDLFLSEIRPTI